MKFNVDLFLTSLGLMGKGMLGIFIVTGVIVLFTVVFGKIAGKIDGKKEESAEEE